MSVRPRAVDAPRPADEHADPVAPIRVRLRNHLRDPINTNVYALTLDTVTTSILGILYWLLAAHLYSPRQVGIGAAMVSTMVFLSALARLNLNGALARFLPAAGTDGRRLVTYAYGMSTLVALAASSIFLLVAPVVSQRLAFLARTPTLALVFVLSVAGWAVFTLQDSVLTALRGVVWVPVENAAFGIGKIVLLVLLAGTLPDTGIFTSWSVAAVLALVPVNALVFRRLLPRLSSWSRPVNLPGRRVLARFVALDYVGYLFWLLSFSALPLIVTALLGAEANGVFYIGWLLGTSLELVAYHFGTSLTVESAADESQIARFTRQVLRRGLFVFLPAVVGMCVFAPALLTLFGRQYAGSGVSVLRLFAAAVLPRLVVIVFLAACRVQRRVGTIVLVQASISVAVITLAVLTVGRLGITGVGIAYLGTQVAAAIAVLPALARILRAQS